MAAEMDCSDAIDGGVGRFVNLCRFHDGCKLLSTPHSSVVILDASPAIKILVLIYIHKIDPKFSTLQYVMF